MIDFPSLKTLTIGNESFEQVTSFSINTLPSLETLVIRNDCFNAVSSHIYFNDFPELLSLKIGSKSFYNEGSGEINKYFQIYNNSKLLSIEIGEYSFGNYNGDFKVMSNPKLQSLTIGSIENESNNFMYVRNIFIEGIRMCVFEWILDLDSLTTLIIGCGSFRQYATSLTITSIRLFYNEI